VPTIHLSLPESLYNELKEYAAEMGVNITDLVRMMIREGLEKYRREKMERMRRKE
jgi:metal-responsive CopG/Arc/MetJ family transcriptional regulator